METGVVLMIMGFLFSLTFLVFFFNPDWFFFFVHLIFSKKEAESTESFTIFLHPGWLQTEEKEQFLRIREIINILAHNKKWISNEAFHYVCETVPCDLNSMAEAYQGVETNAEAQKQVKESLLAIENNLRQYKQEYEKNKLFHLKKMKVVIKQR